MCFRGTLFPFHLNPSQPNKTHPNDWANPGRIRFAYKTPEGKNATPYKSKQQIYVAMAKYLQIHPVTQETAMKAQMPGMQIDKPPPPPAVPKGWKINEILPVYSPALSGGGISDNLMKDLMREEGVVDNTSGKKKGKRRQ